ncbi:polycystin-2-like [Photinus pyralis]|nr:polycystin-2-like [Photinus pyralis]
MEEEEEESEILWPVSELVELEPKPIYARTLAREMLIFIAFFAFVTAVAVTSIDPITYYQYRLFEQLFVESKIPPLDKYPRIGLRDVYSMSDIWRYLEYVFYDGFHWKFYYDERYNTKEIPEDSPDRNVAFDNKLLGVPRLRQLKVRKDSCLINSAFAMGIKQCFGYYSHVTEERNKFGDQSQFVFVETLKSNSYVGKLYTYPGSRGYIVKLAIRDISDDTPNSIPVLKKSLWIGRGTRVVFVEFPTYNSNTNLFCVVKLVFEIPPTGGVVTSHSFRVVRLLRYVTISDYALLACEVIVFLFILAYTVFLGIELNHLGALALTRFWSYMNILIVVMGYVIFGLKIATYMQFNTVKPSLLSTENYVNLEGPAAMQLYQDNAVAFFAFLVYIKVFKFMVISKTLGQLNTTVRKCIWDVITFVILLLIVFIIFALFGYMIFNSEVAEFSSYGVAMFTLFRAILGDFDYSVIEAANAYVAPIYFVLFMLVVFFLALNMFLAIINEAYYHVKLDIAACPKHKRMPWYLKEAFRELFSMAPSEEDDGESPYQAAISEIRDTLNRLGFDDVETELFFSRYNIDPAAQLPSYDPYKLLKEFEAKLRDGKADTRAVESITLEDVIAQQEKMFDLEKVIGLLTTKVDFLLKKLDTLENVRKK